MPDIRDVYTEVDAMELPQLHSRRDELITLAPEGDPSKLDDDALTELLAINRALRKKIAANTGRKRTTTPKEKPSLEDLL